MTNVLRQSIKKTLKILNWINMYDIIISYIEGGNMKFIIKNLSKSYGDKEVLKDLSYTFEKGKIYSVIGRNGTGKTTLFHCLNGEEKYEGPVPQIEEDGVIRELKEEDIYLVSDSPILPEFLTGGEFIDAFVKLNKNADHSLDTEKLFDLFNINESDRNVLIREYSFGMKNKVQLMCAFILKPKIILLDEPLSSFDIIVSHDIKEMLISMKSEHIIIMSTHIVQLATDVSDELAILKNKKLNVAHYDGDRSDLKAFEDYLIGEI